MLMHRTPRPDPSRPIRRHWLPLAAALALLIPLASQAGDTTPAQQQARFNAEAGNPGQAQRGGTFFTNRHLTFAHAGRRCSLPVPRRG